MYLYHTEDWLTSPSESLDGGDHDGNLNRDCPRCDNPQGDGIIAEIDGDNLDREVEDMVVMSDGIYLRR